MMGMANGIRVAGDGRRTTSEIVKQWAASGCNWYPSNKQVQDLLASIGCVETAIHVACQSGAVIREEGE